MPQSIYVIGGFIQVRIVAYFVPGIPAWTDGREAFTDSYYATYKLGNKPWKANLQIDAFIHFPKHTWKIDGNEIISQKYFQVAECTFSNITHDDGKLTFSDIGPVKFQIHPHMGNWAETIEDSFFRFIDGNAVVSASNNPKIPVIKIKLVLGSPDVIVTDMRVESKDAEWKTSTEFGKGNNGSDKPNEAGIASDIWDIVTWGPKKVLDVVRQVEFKVTTEVSGGGGSRQRGLSRTYGKLSEQPEWTLSLELPEPAPKPQPTTALTWHNVYFLTGKKDLIGPNNISSQFPDSKDQIKSLQEFMNGVYGKFGYKNITSIEVEGHASGLGDSAGNLTLSFDRAQYVKTLLGQMYSQISPSTIFAKGSPPEKNNKDNDPYDRVVKIRINIRDANKRVL